MNIEKMREEFEERNGHRAWFVAGGRKDTGPEGYVYDDFTTDMCWTCWVDSRESLVIDLDAAAKALAESMDYPWDFMPEQGRTRMKANARMVIEAAGLKAKS